MINKEALYLKTAIYCFSTLLIALAYSHLREIGFARVDDKWMLINNPLVKNSILNLDYLMMVFTSFNNIQYSPLNTLYYNLIYKINGFDPYYYHLGSLLIHCLNSILVFTVCRKIMTLFKEKKTTVIALLITIIWAVNPINVESVVWISASKVLLFTLFSLLTLLYFIKILEERAVKDYFLCFLFFIISFLFKEQSVMTPFMLFALHFIYNYKDKKKLKDKATLVLFAGMLIAVTIFCIITLKANGAEPEDISKYPFSQRIILSFYCLFFYIFNLFIPAGLHYHYPFPMEPGEPLPLTYYLFVILFIVIIYCFRKSLVGIAKNKFYIFCGIAAMIQLILCLQIVPMTRPAMMADRYMYLPSVFIIMMVISIIYKNTHYNPKVKYLSHYALVFYIGFFILYSNKLVLNWINLTIQSL